MNKEIMSISHNDMDGYVSEMVLEWKFGDKIQYWNTNYRNIAELTDEMVEYFYQYEIKLIMITDVSMSQNKAELIKLSKLGVPVILLDHHMYSDGWFDNLPENVTYVHDKDRCGAKITFDYFNCSNENLGKLVEFVNAYDLWKLKDPKFPIAFDINNYFWEVGMLETRLRIKKNNYDLPRDYLEVTNMIKARAKKRIQTLRDKNLIHSTEHITIAFTDDGFDELVLEEMDNGKEVVLIGASYGHIKVRVKQEGILTEAQKILIKTELDCLDVGHLDAFPVIVQNANFKKLMKRVQEVTQVFGKYINERCRSNGY